MSKNITTIEVMTILSNRTQEGKVNFTVEKEIDDKGTKIKIETQWDLNKAREIRDMISAAVEAAISDEILWKFLRNKVGLKEEACAAALLDFRELRQGTKQTVYPS